MSHMNHACLFLSPSDSDNNPTIAEFFHMLETREWDMIV